MLEVRQIAGVCPQADIHFDILTVEENLSIFAAIKGIPQNDLIQEVGQLGTDVCPESKTPSHSTDASLKQACREKLLHKRYRQYFYKDKLLISPRKSKHS